MRPWERGVTQKMGMRAQKHIMRAWERIMGAWEHSIGARDETMPKKRAWELQEQGL